MHAAGILDIKIGQGSKCNYSKFQKKSTVLVSEKSSVSCNGETGKSFPLNFIVWYVYNYMWTSITTCSDDNDSDKTNCFIPCV